MISDIIIPQLGEGTDSVVLLEWRKSVGDEVKEGEVLFDVDVDKAVVEIPAFADGVLTEILVDDDTEVVPLQVVGRLETAEESG